MPLPPLFVMDLYSYMTALDLYLYTTVLDQYSYTTVLDLQVFFGFLPWIQPWIQ